MPEEKPHVRVEMYDRNRPSLSRDLLLAEIAGKTAGANVHRRNAFNGVAPLVINLDARPPLPAMLRDGIRLPKAIKPLDKQP